MHYSFSLRGIKKFSTILSALIPLLILSQPITAQPSGGPYGPVPQNYSLPETDGRIYYVEPDGSKENDGRSIDHPTSLEKAFEQVVTGDAIILRGGTYRTGNLMLNQGITLQPYRDELPVLKGTFVAGEWRDLGNGLWTTQWEHLFPMKPQGWWRRDRSGKSTPLHRFNNDMVFIDGEFLQSAAYEGEVDAHSFYIDYESGTVYIGQDPQDKLVEITAFNVAIHRKTSECHGKKSDGKGPVIRGITFTQYAYRAIEIEGTDPEGISPESEHGKEVVGTIIEHCSITYCSRVAAYLRGNNLILRHCKISDTSTEGIYLLSSSDVLLEKNIFTRNNIEHIDGYFPAAVKIFNQCYRVKCNDNLVTDLPYSNGIWYDVGNVDAVFTNNWIENVGSTDFEIRRDQVWPSNNGFFFEISKGALVAGNVFINCDHGLMILNSSDVKIWQNTFINSMAVIGRNERTAQGDHFGWHPATGPAIDAREGHVFENNLLVGDAVYHRPFVFIWQRDWLCNELTQPQMESMDHNVYVRSDLHKKEDLILWAPAKRESCLANYTSPEQMHASLPDFSGHSKDYILEKIPVFRSVALKNFELLPDFPGKKSAVKPPANIRVLLRDPENKPYIGAYPLQ